MMVYNKNGRSYNIVLAFILQTFSARESKQTQDPDKEADKRIPANASETLNLTDARGSCNYNIIQLSLKLSDKNKNKGGLSISLNLNLQWLISGGRYPDLGIRWDKLNCERWTSIEIFDLTKRCSP